MYTSTLICAQQVFKLYAIDPQPLNNIDDPQMYQMPDVWAKYWFDNPSSCDKPIRKLLNKHVRNRSSCTHSRYSNAHDRAIHNKYNLYTQIFDKYTVDSQMGKVIRQALIGDKYAVAKDSIVKIYIQAYFVGLCATNTHIIKVHTEKFKVFIKMLTGNDFGG